MRNSLSAVSERVRGLASALAARAMRAILALALSLPALSVAPRPAEAQSCSFSISAITFGSVSAVGGSSPVSTTGTLGVSCSHLNLLGLPLPVTITVCPNLDAGSGGSSGSSRLMTGPGAPTLPYQLYQDAAHTQPWGAAKFLQFGTVPTLIYTSDKTGTLSATQTIYAAVTPQAAATAGTYSSTFSGESFYWGANILTCAGVTVGYLVAPSAFTVSASVPVNCQLTVSPLNFGATGLLTAAVAATTSVGVDCTAGAPYTVSLSAGLTGTGPTQRLMTNGAQKITYGLYQDSKYRTPWGDAVGYQAGGTGTGSSQVLTVYGQVPAQTTPAPGVYADTVVVTLSY